MVKRPFSVFSHRDYKSGMTEQERLICNDKIEELSKKLKIDRNMSLSPRTHRLAFERREFILGEGGRLYERTHKKTTAIENRYCIPKIHRQEVWVVSGIVVTDHYTQDTELEVVEIELADRSVDLPSHSEKNKDTALLPPYSPAPFSVFASVLGQHEPGDLVTKANKLIAKLGKNYKYNVGIPMTPRTRRLTFSGTRYSMHEEILFEQPNTCYTYTPLEDLKLPLIPRTDSSFLGQVICLFQREPKGTLHVLPSGVTRVQSPEKLKAPNVEAKKITTQTAGEVFGKIEEPRLTDYLCARKSSTLERTQQKPAERTVQTQTSDDKDSEGPFQLVRENKKKRRNARRNNGRTENTRAPVDDSSSTVLSNQEERLSDEERDCSPESHKRLLRPRGYSSTPH